MRCAMALIGAASLSDLGPHCLAPAEPLARNWLESAFPLVREGYGAAAEDIRDFGAESAGQLDWSETASEADTMNIWSRDQSAGAGRRRHRLGNHRRHASCVGRGRPCLRARFRLRYRRHRLGRPSERRHHLSGGDPRTRSRPPTACCSARCRTTNIRRPGRAGSIPPANCAISSIFLPTSAPRAPARAFRPCGAPFDLVIVRENTEGFYSDRTMYRGTGEFMPTPDLAMAMRKVTRPARAIAEAAFELARRRRRKVTSVHKSNVLRVSDGLFLNAPAPWRRASGRSI